MVNLFLKTAIEWFWKRAKAKSAKYGSFFVEINTTINIPLHYFYFNKCGKKQRKTRVITKRKTSG